MKRTSTTVASLFFLGAVLVVSYQNCGQEQEAGKGVTTKAPTRSAASTGEEGDEAPSSYVELLVNGKTSISTVRPGEFLNFEMTSHNLRTIFSHYWVTDAANIPRADTCPEGYSQDYADKRQGVTSPVVATGAAPWMVAEVQANLNQEDKKVGDPLKLETCQAGLRYHIVVFGEGKKDGRIYSAKVTISTVP